MKLNINERIHVHLTPDGMKTLREYEKGKPVGVIRVYHPCEGPGAPTMVYLPVWELMAIFGGHMYNGAPQEFVDGVIIIGEDL